MTRVVACLVAIVGMAGVLAAAATSASAAGDVVERPSVTPLLDAYLPASPPSSLSPAVLFVHGGGWNKGSRRWWSGHARAFTGRTGWPTFTVDYALDAPQPWRAQPADVRAAVAWVRANAPSYGVDPARIALVGSSAGAHLAMLTGTTGAGAAAVVSLAGVADLPGLRGTSIEPLAASMLGDGPAPRWRALSPVTHVDPLDPPMLLVASEDDPLVPSSQSRRMADALAGAGVPVELEVLPGAEHVLGTRAMPLVESFLRRTFSGSTG